jgi:peptidoglycan/xylan/chitin deacetylase (PgdA/CDA1 family)
MGRPSLLSAGLQIFCCCIFLSYVKSQDIVTDPACEAVTGCDAASDCRCPSILPPLYETINTNYSALPQIVVLSFDDAITRPMYDEFYAILFANKFNPNGCPIRATFFLMHDNTDYTVVHELWRNGFEIASHSMTHKVPTESWASLTLDEYANEMRGLKESTAKFATINANDIVGVRAPFLQMNGDTYGQMMVQEGFQWDASRPTRIRMYDGLWPYTYNYVYQENVFLDCPIPPCINNTFPGIWQVPINDLNDTRGDECAMLDQCSGRPENYDEAMDLLWKNFRIRYEGNRAPYNLFTHASWFTGEELAHNFAALNDWLDEVLLLEDVYVITISNMIDFVRFPVTIDEAATDPTFTCDDYYPTPPADACSVSAPNGCTYCDANQNQKFLMRICGRCPPCHPNPLDPLGECGGGGTDLIFCTPP